ncbi:MAG TPA: NfeD family protein [Edaphobacter sp.]|jgi:membrane protein implicated in regulation of membrane protease activity|nr:NfeD family protein [Edaphobacter sp.]
MTMDTFYLICFGVGLVLSVAFFLGGFGHLHLGHLHIGHSGLAHHGTGAHGSGSRGLSAVNGFTLTAFLCWFGGAGYLLHRYSIFVAPLVLLFSVVSGVFGAALLWAVLFKVLLPRERVLSAEDTEMTGVLAKVSDSIRSNGGIGEILFSQTGARRCSAARSDDGRSIERGTEVVVIRYERGVAYVRPWAELEGDPLNGLPDRL